MTTVDKSKPWLNQSSPEWEPCKQAARKLYDELQALGVDTNGIGVGVTDDNQHAAINVYLETKKHIKKIPAVYDDHPVIVRVVGVIRPL